MNYNKWYFNNESKTALYFLRTFNNGYGFNVNKTWFHRNVKWKTKDFIPALKSDVVEWFKKYKHPMNTNEINFNLKMSFPDYDKVSKKLEDIHTQSKPDDIIQYKLPDGVWEKIPLHLEKFTELEFRIKPKYENFKKFDPVLVTFEGDNKEYIRLYSGLNVSGDPMIFDESNSIKSTLDRKVVKTCKKIKTN